MVDSNNNSAVGKYSLRPRSESKKLADNCAEEVATSLLACKSRTRRTSRQRSQPLSKYRRRSANARERSRMREINQAFETLRRMVSWGSENQAEKTTKISTLRLAMGYIAALSDALRTPGGEVVAESPEDPETVIRLGHHRFECERPSVEFESVSRTSLSFQSANIGNSSSSFVKPNDFTSEAVSGIIVSEKSAFLKIHMNPEVEIISSSTDGFLQDGSTSTADGNVNNNVTSIPITMENLVSEFNLQSTEETQKFSPSAFSSDCPFSSIKTLNKSSKAKCCELNDQLSGEKTLFAKESFEKDSVLDAVTPEYDDSFLPVDKELGSIPPMSHISLEEFLNS